MSKYDFREVNERFKQASDAYHRAALWKGEVENAGKKYLSLLTGKPMINFYGPFWEPDSSSFTIYDKIGKRRWRITEQDLDKPDEEVIAIREASRKAERDAARAKTARDRKMLYIKLKAEFEKGESDAL